MYLFKEKEEKTIDDKEQDKIELQEVTDNSAVSIQLGYGLIKLVDRGQYWSCLKSHWSKKAGFKRTRFFFHL